MRFSDEDLERLVIGNNPESQELSRLATALQEWQADFSRTPTEERVSAFAAQAAEIVSKNGAAASTASHAAPTRSRLRALKYKLATGMAAVLMLSGMTGVAVASDEAAPGDALYGIDRALENIGVGNGGAAERITEARSLFEAGLTAEAVEHAAEALEGDESAAEAVTSLLNAAERVRANAEKGNAEATLNRVAEMLEMMADTERGPEFGKMVSQMARGIYDADTSDAGPPSDLPEQANEKAQENNSKNSGERGRGNQGPPDEPPGQSKSGRP